MSLQKYLESPEFQAMLKREREYNLPRLQKLREMLDSGEVKMNRELMTNCDLWEFKWVNCMGIKCKGRGIHDVHECPLEATPQGCWWLKAYQWRKKHEKEIRNRWTFMRKHSDI